MTREVMILRWCDGDHEDQVRAEVERVVSLDGKPPRLVDLCQVCDKVFVDVEWLLERGADADEVEPRQPRRTAESSHPKRVMKRKKKRKSTPGVERVDCPEPECVDYRTGKRYVGPTRAALGQHIKARHNKKISDYDWSE